MAVVSLVVGPGLWGAQASVVAVNGLQSSGLVACGIFLDQGSNLCLLHRPVNSSLLSHQGSLTSLIRVLMVYYFIYLYNI